MFLCMRPGVKDNRSRLKCGCSVVNQIQSPTKQLTPCHISLTAHISPMCAFVTENCSDALRDTWERCRTQLSALWMSKVLSACTLGQTHSSSPRLPPPTPHPLSHHSPAHSFLSVPQALHVHWAPGCLYLPFSLLWTPFHEILTWLDFWGCSSALSSLSLSWPLWLSLPRLLPLWVSATPKVVFPLSCPSL